MSDLSSVNKIKSLKQCIEQTTGESYSDLTVAIQALKDGYGSDSGGASGIIDVTELPTSNIDTNAVYRVTESVQTNKTEIYVIAYLNNSRVIVTAQQYLAYLGVPTVPNIYVVDELSNLKPTDVQYFTEVNLYILRSDGICYIALANGAIITLGLMGFEKPDRDKGFTDNIYEETEYGVYTTIEAYKEVIRYFYRKDGNWEEISATMSETLWNDLNNIDVLSGSYSASPMTILQNGASLNVRDLILNERTIPSKVTVDVPCTADLIFSSGDPLNISKEYFRKKDGTYIGIIAAYAFANKSNIVSMDLPDSVYYINDYAFYGCGISEISLPDSVVHIGRYSFAHCSNLESVSLPNSLEVIESNLFENCGKLASITFPQGVSEIGWYAFERCTSLKNINIPANVEIIGYYAFANCNLNDVVFEDTPTDLSSYAFQHSSVRTIRCPWKEGEVPGAPWGAYDVVIIYSDSNSDPDENLVPTSIDEYGDIYNQCGYKDGLKFDTVVFEPHVDAEGHTVTGYILALNGAAFRISGAPWSIASDSYIAVYDRDFVNIWAVKLDGNAVAESGISYDGNVAVFESSKVTNCDLSEMLYIRISAECSGADLIVTSYQSTT